jgi:Na+/proline symporter
VIGAAIDAGKFQFWPEGGSKEWLAFAAAWATLALGSIPQQDVFQRVTSAKSARIALWGSVLGASIYFCFTFVPMFIAYSATLIHPEQFAALLEGDSQLILPTLVLQHTPLLAQVLFFGAVLSAIMSCSSATLLAPSVTFAENVIKGFYPKMGDHRFLWVMRATIVCFAGLVLAFALNSQASIFKMVENAYKVTLAGAFVPLVCGIFWKRATSQGALAAIFGGILSWLMIEAMIGEASPVPPQLIGLGVSLLGMAAGSLLPQWVGRPTHAPALHGHHAAAQTHHVPHDGEQHHPH